MRRLMFVAAVLICGTAQAQEDGTGFVAMLNQARAMRGLPAVRYSPEAAYVASVNNGYQALYGLGHHYTGSFGQVAAVGVGDAQAALSAWAGSPAHAALLFAPDLVGIGFHIAGGVATASTQQSFAYAYQPPYYIWYGR